MRILILTFVLSITFAPAICQIYSVGNDDGFAYNSYVQGDNPTLAIYSVGSGDGFGLASAGGLGSEIPLPVDLILFESECVKNAVLLKWVTASEQNNDYFTIERSDDALNWQVAGRVNGAGNSVVTLKYSFINELSAFNFKPSTVLYYRLKQTDYDGKFEYSKIITVECIEDKGVAVNLYPNPVYSELVIEVAGNKGALDFEIFNSMGSAVYSGSLDAKTIIQTGSFAPDVYLIRFINGKAYKFVKTIEE